MYSNPKGLSEVVIDSELSSTSQNPVQNKVIKEKFDLLQKDWGTFTLTSSGWSSELTDGYYTNQVAVDGMLATYNPFCDLVVTSAELSKDERTAISKIIKIETFDGYVIAKALEVPTIDINVRFMGV